MTCKECFHYEVCNIIDYKMEYQNKSQLECETEMCDKFKDKLEIVELPCKLGEDCYKVFSGLKVIVKSKLKTADLIGDVIDGLITTDKAEAEQKLKELNK